MVAGYPKLLREVHDAGRIGASPSSSIFRVTSVGEGFCKCQIDEEDIISYDEGQVPEAGTDMGGLSGGPVFLVRQLDYPLIGVITDQCYMGFVNLEVLQIATLAYVVIK